MADEQNTDAMSEDEPQKPKTKLEKLISIASSLLLAFAVCFCAYVLIQIRQNGHVSVFGCSVFHVVSGSMEPEIPVGALILSQKTDIEDLAVGDIICFYSREAYMEGRVVTHRVIEIHQQDGAPALVTRGDANNSMDAYYVTRDNLIGRMIYHTKNGNFVTSLYGFLTNKAGFFVVIIVPVMLLTVFILQDNMRKIRKEIEKIKREAAQLKADNDSAQEEDSDSSRDE